MDIVFADISYLDVIANIERSCFPEEQAAKKHQFCERLSVYPKHFLLAKDDSGDIAAFINGFVTDLADLTDEMYTTPSLHDENGAWRKKPDGKIPEPCRRTGQKGRSADLQAVAYRVL